MHPKSDGDRHSGRDLLFISWEGPEILPFTKALRNSTSKSSIVVLCRKGIAEGDEITEIQ